MAAANIISSLFSVVLFIYLARTLGPESLGYISYAFTFVFFLSNFIDLGLSTYGMREVAKDTTGVSNYVSEIVSFRIVIASVIVAVSAFFIFTIQGLTVARLVILESLLMLFTCALATEWAFQGIEKMHMVLVSFAVTSTLQICLVLLLVKGPKDFVKVPLIYFFATLPIICAYLKRLGFRLRLKAGDLKRMSYHLSSSLVIWAISLFAQVYNSFDVFILGLFRSAGDVGYFTISRRAAGALSLFIVFLANAILPRLSHALGTDKAQFKSATGKFLKTALLIAVFVFLPIIIFSDKLIMLTVGSDYLPASLPLRIMTTGLIFVLFNVPYSTGLIASGLEREVLKQAGACAAFSVISNFILIPKYGMIGASVSFVFAEGLALAWILYVYHRRIRFYIK